jgi:hexosaminidase
MKFSTMVLVLLWTLSGAVRADEGSLVPRPAAIHDAAGSFTVSPTTPVATDPRDKAAIDAASRFLDLLAQSDAVRLTSGIGANAIRFVTDRKIAGAEAYRLTIAPTGITVAASRPAGLFYGAVTLWQLLTEAPGNGPVTLTARTIDDAPRFAWRGLMIDSARHFQSAEYIKRYIDWMAALKLNVLHWHLTDDQGWRLEIKHYPKLTSIGAWSVPAGPAAQADIDPATGKPRLVGGFYTQQQVKEIVAYAAARHISIVPEIEMPGHAAAAIAAYPDLGTEPVIGGRPSSAWGVHYNLYNIDDKTFTFIETVLTEVMALFPSPYIHVGGDEAVKDQWKASPHIQQRMKAMGVADEDALQGWFIRRIEAFLEQHNRRLVGWDEILQGGIAPHATVMSWRGIEGAVAAAKSGHDTILSPAPMLYFDNRQSEAPNEPPGRGLVVALKDVYGFDPMPPAMPASDQHHVLGVQANLWTEHVRTEDQATRMTYPRAAALAEIAWTPAAGIDFQDFSARLPIERQRFHRLGLHEDNPPPKKEANRLYSQELRLCSAHPHALQLEDDAPINGPRAVFLVDVIDPCWHLPQVDLSKAITLEVSVGQIPYNLVFGGESLEYRPRPPRSPDGELDVRADGCGGDPIATLPLAPATRSFATTTLSASLPAQAGIHDLCFTFTGKDAKTLWVIDWISMETKP